MSYEMLIHQSSNGHHNLRFLTLLTIFIDKRCVILVTIGVINILDESPDEFITIIYVSFNLKERCSRTSESFTSIHQLQLHNHFYSTVRKGYVGVKMPVYKSY
uniref:Uncharacterized protein n=1 Tax=Cacopsylla melanoneura TaxID=428564 RepID=A0A8D8WNA7_9HEMI